MNGKCIMKKILVLLILIISISCVSVEAKRGCCSGNGGVAYCGQSGHYVCNNGEVSPSCQCDEPDYTTYEEDAANGDLYYGEDEDFVDSDDSEGGNSLGYVDTEGNIFHIDDSTSKDSLAANIKGTVGEDGIEKYLEIGALLLLITGASYSTGKYVGSRKKN